MSPENLTFKFITITKPFLSPATCHCGYNSCVPANLSQSVYRMCLHYIFLITSASLATLSLSDLPDSGSPGIILKSRELGHRTLALTDEEDAG